MSLRPSLLVLALAGCATVSPAFASPVAGSAQASPNATAESAALPSTETLPKNYPVVTFEDKCQFGATKANSSGSVCKNIVTRAEFEELVDGINPRMTKAERRDLAKNYSKVVGLSREAIKRGLDKQPRMLARLRYSRLTILANAMAMELYREGDSTTPDQVERYYASHKALFDVYTVKRIFVPQEKQGESAGATPSEGEMEALAKDVHERALAGEDFASLQEFASQAAGIKALRPADMEIERGALPAEQSEVFDLAPGKVSGVFTDRSGHYIYKMVSRRTPAFDDIRERVEASMKTQGMNQALSKIEEITKAKVNDAYFDKYDPPPPDPNAPDLDTD
jgi:parvulin-like peptidyl-prolyl cis-trans isomerase-like protein